MCISLLSNIGLEIIDYRSDSYPFAREPGKAAETRESLKLVKYEELTSNYLLTPIAIGPWIPMGLKGRFFTETGKIGTG